jgi:catechol 2,3-dioxygenase-like lactoylglutathione lyase family enzyme
MRLDHIAYRVADRYKAADFFISSLGYRLSPDMPEGFDIQFEDGTNAQCLILEPPEAESTSTGRIAHGHFGAEWHSPPEIFVSDGSKNSIVAEWVQEEGPGIHHLAYEVDSVELTMLHWSAKFGTKFTTKEPLRCEGLIQAFTQPHPVTGLIYEIIERTTQGFCKDNVKDLMESTRSEK